MNPQQVGELVDPAALRRMFERKAPEFRQSYLSDKKVVNHPKAGKLHQQWNQVVSSVVSPPGTRPGFYRSMFKDQLLGGLLRVEIKASPVMRINGLPNNPSVNFIATGVRELFNTFGGEQKLTAADAEMMAALLNSSLQAQQGNEQFGKMFNMFPLMAEFVYQLRLIHRERDKQVVFFKDEPGGSSPTIDAAGTLYLPVNFFNSLSSSEQELVLIHEASHLSLPGGELLMQLLLNRADAMGPMKDMMAKSDFRKRLRKSNKDNELDIDARVLAYLVKKPGMRNSYHALIQRIEPGSQRANVIGYLNRGITTGQWPRPVVRLSMQDLLPAFQALVNYESQPAGAEKVDAMVVFVTSAINTLPEKEKLFYKPLFNIIIEHYKLKPESLIVGAGLRHKPSDQEKIGKGLSYMFNELMIKMEK